MRYTIVILFLVAIGAVLVGCARDDTESIPYEPDFVELVEAGKVDQVRVVLESSGLMRITGRTKPDSSPGKKFRVEVVGSEDSVADLLSINKVAYSVEVSQPEPDGSRSPATLPILVTLTWAVVSIGVSIFLIWLALRFVRAVERIADNMEK